jgi:hypothetical protein
METSEACPKGANFVDKANKIYEVNFVDKTSKISEASEASEARDMWDVCGFVCGEIGLLWAGAFGALLSYAWLLAKRFVCGKNNPAFLAGPLGATGQRRRIWTVYV